MHDLYETGDPDAPDCVRDRNGDVVLELCRRCGRGEVELSEPCSTLRKERGFQMKNETEGYITEDELINQLRSEGYNITRRKLRRYVKAGLIPRPIVNCGMRPGQLCVSPDKCNPSRCYHPTTPIGTA